MLQIRSESRYGPIGIDENTRRDLFVLLPVHGEFLFPKHFGIRHGHLVDEVSLEPEGDRLRIILKGNLAGMLRLAHEDKRPSETDDLVDQMLLVAGACNKLNVEFSWTAA